jgi:hypothetical protein
MEAFIASLIFFALAIFLTIGARAGQSIDARSADIADLPMLTLKRHRQLILL